MGRRCRACRRGGCCRRCVSRTIAGWPDLGLFSKQELRVLERDPSAAMVGGGMEEKAQNRRNVCMCVCENGEKREGPRRGTPGGDDAMTTEA